MYFVTWFKDVDFTFKPISLFGLMCYLLGNYIAGSDFRAVDGNLAFASNQGRSACFLKFFRVFLSHCMEQRFL